jgi:diadenosine tetraphosphate (Ap4A) HIT family hydrolase/SAM-dependent methyltransferase
MGTPEGCPICHEPPTAEVIADLPATWVTAPRDAPLPGYVCVVSKLHAVEPFELAPRERRAFWDEVNIVAEAISAALRPKKLNYEIHGNTIPHLHLHLFPRQPGDRFEGRPIDGRVRVPRSDAEIERLRSALAPLRDAPSDPYAVQKDLAWRETAAIDGRLERGEIDEATWHAEMARLIVPAYLAAATPWQGSGKSGTERDWEHARSHIGHAIDRDGSFLDVGCANGYLLECLPRWTPHALDRYGLDIAPELVALARQRLPELADRLYTGNALDWTPPRRFTFVRAGLEYVPPHRRREVVERLLGWCERLIIGVFGEELEARPTEELLTSWGLRVAGRSERVNRRKPEVAYRVLWIDASDARS